jgi:hypothetical protein
LTNATNQVGRTTEMAASAGSSFRLGIHFPPALVKRSKEFEGRIQLRLPVAAILGDEAKRFGWPSPRFLACSHRPAVLLQEYSCGAFLRQAEPVFLQARSSSPLVVDRTPAVSATTWNVWPSPLR